MKYYENIDITVGANIEIIVYNDGILKYLKELLSSNFNFKYKEIKNDKNTVLLISEQDVSYAVFKRHFEIINDSDLENHKY